MFTRLTIYVLLALAPLPFGSARPGWQWFWMLLIGFAAITHALAILMRKSPSQPIPQILKAVAALFLVFVAWGFFQASPFFSHVGSVASLSLDSPSDGSQGYHLGANKTLATTMFFLSHLVFFFLVFSYCTNSQQAINLIRFCGMVAFFYAAYGFIAYVSGNDMILWYERKSLGSSNSLTSSFVNRNNFAAFAGIGLQCLIAYNYIALNKHFRRQRRQGGLQFRHMLESIVLRAWRPGLAIMVVAIALLLSESRGGFVSVVIATIMMIALSRRPEAEGWSRRGTLVAYAAVLITAIALVALSGNQLESRLTEDAGNSSRFDLYPLLIEAIADSPLTGTGLGTFSEVFPLYRTEDIRILFLRAHSDYLELVLTAGIPAALLLFIACFTPAVFLLRQLAASHEYRCFVALGLSVTVQISLHSLIDFPLQIPAVSYLTCAVLAASAALAARPAKTGDQPRKQRMP